MGIKYDAGFELERPFAEWTMRYSGKRITQVHMQELAMDVWLEAHRAFAAGTPAKKIYDELRLNCVCYGVRV